MTKAINAVPKNKPKAPSKETLVQWLEHVAGVGAPIEIKLVNGETHTIEGNAHYFTTHCETCKEIAVYLERYHEGGAQ